MTNTELKLVAPELGRRDGPLLAVHDLAIASTFGDRQLTLVSDVNLIVNRGETIGIVGESGSGKSMTARAIARLLPEGVRASGEVNYCGRDVLGLSDREFDPLRGAGISLLLQDPFTMLNPLVRCGVSIGDGSAFRARFASKEARRSEIVRRLREVEISNPGVADRYPFELSGGMLQRVALAAALAGDPDLLIADEPTTALDATTQSGILSLLASLKETRGMGLILITHDLRVAFATCDRIYVLYAGALLEVGRAHEIQREPFHPYTLGLLHAEPSVDARLGDLRAIPGAVPAADSVIGTCAFASRCSWVREECTRQRPKLTSVEPGRWTSCLRFDDIRGAMASLQRVAEATPSLPQGNSSPAALVKVRDVQKRFASRGSLNTTVWALKGVSIDIGPSECVGLVGESGSGKTTLGRCLVGLTLPTHGEIVIDGMPADYAQSHRSAVVQALRRTIQIVFQDPYSSLNPSRTVGSTLREVLALREPRVSDRNRAVAELLERVGLPASYASRKPIALSGGERQRVAIARALAREPRIIVCDEPVSSLDVSVQAQILNLFRSLKDELDMSFLFISHDLAVVRQVAERVYVMYQGEIVEHGSIDDVLDRPQHPYAQQLVRSAARPADSDSSS
jgi:peptide/nickel transport system ATP-binding protein